METIRWLWLLSVFFSVVGLLYVWRFAQRLPSKYENRLSGVKDKASWLLYVLFFVALCYSLFDLVSAWQSFSLWADAFAVVAFLLIGNLVVSLLQWNQKFKKDKIRARWLSPLGFCFIGLSVVFKVGDQTPAVAAKMAAAVSGTAIGKSAGDAAQAVVSTVAQAVGKTRIVQSLATETLEGVIVFRNTLEKGSIGDRVSHKVFVVHKKYSHHQSKFKGGKGIDGVYSHTDKSGQKQLFLVENKIKGARLAEGQMSDGWVSTKIAEMNKYGDKSVRETAPMIEAAMSPTSSIIVRKVLVEHNLQTGVLQCFNVNADGLKDAMRWEENYEPTMREILKAYKEKLSGIVDPAYDDFDLVGAKEL